MTNELREAAQLALEDIDGFFWNGHLSSERDAIRAFIASSAATNEAAGQWQPIETAPKDGTEIMLSNGESVAQGSWMDEPPRITERRDLDGRYIDQDEYEGYTGWIDYGGGMLPEPTHWMPIPAAPGAPTASPAPASMAEPYSGITPLEQRAALATQPVQAQGETEPVTVPADYLQGHADGLEWAALVVEAEDPRTGDWLHDDRNDLAEAIRRGPDMPPAAPAVDRGMSEALPMAGKAELRALFRDAIDWGRSYGQRLNLSDITLDDVCDGFVVKARAAIAASAPSQAEPVAAAGVPSDARLNKVADDLFDYQRIGDTVTGLNRDAFREIIGSAICAFLATPPAPASEAPTQAGSCQASAEELCALVKEFGRVSDNVGRSRGENNYANNTIAVNRCVDLESQICAAIRSTAPPAGRTLTAEQAERICAALDPSDSGSESVAAFVRSLAASSTTAGERDHG